MTDVHDPLPSNVTSVDGFSVSLAPERGENPKDRIGALKPQISLVPPALRIWTAEAMRDGAEKYGPYNWRENAVKALTYVEAAGRHLDSWSDGEDLAQDSGVHHLAHAAACLAILIDALETGNLVDDRPPPGCASELIARLTRKAEPAPPLPHN